MISSILCISPMHLNGDNNKFFLTLCFSIFCYIVCAQTKEASPVKQVINTLKERITLEGYMQLSYTYDDSEINDANTFEIKRAIIMARGKITDNWSCYFSYNFANTGKILEAYTDYTFLPELKVRLGQFKTMFTIENPLSPCDMELINVYSQATNYLAGYNGSDPLYGSNAGRDLGIMLYGDLFSQFVSYKLAVMNGQGINKKDGNKQKDLVGNLMIHPLDWLTLCGSFIKGTGCAVAESAINPQIHIGDNYTRNRWAIGALIKTSPINVRTEYMKGKDGHVRSEGGYVTASIHVLPKVDLIASYDYFNKNTQAVDKQTNYVAGFHWWFYPKCRLQMQYTRCKPNQGEASNLLQAQIQVRF